MSAPSTKKGASGNEVAAAATLQAGTLIYTAHKVRSRAQLNPHCLQGCFHDLHERNIGF